MISVTPQSITRLAEAIGVTVDAPDGLTENLAEAIVDSAANEARLARGAREGMRDRFAMAALQGLLAGERDSDALGHSDDNPGNRFERAAKFAWAHADAMLAARGPSAPAPKGLRAWLKDLSDKLDREAEMFPASRRAP